MRSKRFRAALLLLIAAALVAVWWSFAERRGSLTDRVTKLLDGDVSRRITNFEYLERRDGRLLFRLLAESSTEDSEGTSQLSGVWLEHYDPQGVLIETVQGGQARYDPANSDVLVRDAVIVELADGTRVLAEALKADLVDGLIRIDGDFQLEKDVLEGRGRGLSYRTERQRLDVDDLESLRFPLPDGEVEAFARTLTYDLPQGRFLFRVNAVLRGPLRALAADEIVLWLSPDQALRQVDARGGARLTAGPDRSFEGREICLFFDEARQRLNHFEVTGNSDAASLEQPRVARFLQEDETGQFDLEAARMVGRTGGAEGPRLEELEAEGDVVLRSRSLGIEDSEARRFVAGFSPVYGGLTSVRMEGGVELVRRSPRTRAREYLRSRDLDVELGADSTIRRMRASGSVNLEMVDGPLRRDLEAREIVELKYEDGLLSEATADGEAVLDVREPEQRSVLRAPTMRAVFDSGLLRQVEAGEGVEVEIESAGTHRRTRSLTLKAAYGPNGLDHAVQEGRVRLWESSPDSVVEIQSEKAILEAAGDRVVASGGRVLLQTEQEGGGDRQETLADQIILDRRRQTILATGRVETVSRREGEPVLITAGRMALDRGAQSVRYTENPRLAQGPTTVRGDTLTLGAEELTMEGNVRSQLVEESDDGVNSYDITADRMHYSPVERVVTYRGSVHVEGDDLDVTAPEVKLFSNARDQGVEKIVASGGAVIVEQGRKWSAQTATYLPREQRVIVGN